MNGCLASEEDEPWLMLTSSKSGERLLCVILKTKDLEVEESIEGVSWTELEVGQGSSEGSKELHG